MTAIPDPIDPEPTPASVPCCAAQDCTRPVDGYHGPPWCDPHRRGLSLAVAITDVVAEYLNVRGNPPISDQRVIEAGNLIGDGLALLLSHAFGESVTMYENPIRFGTGTLDDSPRWRVWFRWEIET